MNTFKVKLNRIIKPFPCSIYIKLTTFLTMKSYIKIFGPPLQKALVELEKIAIDMPEVCVMDTVISYEIHPSLAKDIGGHVLSHGETVSNYYFSRTGVSVPRERCENIISKSGESLGEYHFYFEWFKKPSVSQVQDLIERIDEALTPLGVMYTITTK